MGVLSLVSVGDVLPLIGLKDSELVCYVWVRAEEGCEVDVWNCRSCHRLSTWRNCSTMRTTAHATLNGIASPTTPASSTTCVSAKALVAFPLLSLCIHLGLTSPTIGTVS